MMSPTLTLHILEEWGVCKNKTWARRGHRATSVCWGYRKQRLVSPTRSARVCSSSSSLWQWPQSTGSQYGMN